MTTIAGTPAGTVAQQMSHAADSWLSELSETQRPLGSWDAPGGTAEDERRRWFYTPTDHGGLPLNAQSPHQQRRAMELVATGLSAEGYALVSTILGTENILDRVEGFSTEFDTRRGRDPSRYYLRVFGHPDDVGTWGWQFGGHHVSLNFLIVDGEVRSSTPRFFGLDPAVSPLPGGARLDPLGGFESAGRALVSSLSGAARDRAILLDRAPADIVLGNRSSFEGHATVMELAEIFRRRPGDEDLIERLRVGGQARDAATGYGAADHERISLTSTPKGIPGSELDGRQQRLLDRLVRVYHDGLPDGLSETWDVRRLHFAWAGAVDAGAPHYYRIQGDGLLIEWDNTARNGNHAHGVVRDLRNDFGADVLRTHLANLHPTRAERTR